MSKWDKVGTLYAPFDAMAGLQEYLNARPGEVIRVPRGQHPDQYYAMLQQQGAAQQLTNIWTGAFVGGLGGYVNQLGNLAAPHLTPEQEWRREAEREVDALCPVLAEPIGCAERPSRWLRFLYWLARKLDHPLLRSA